MRSVTAVNTAMCELRLLGERKNKHCIWEEFCYNDTLHCKTCSMFCTVCIALSHDATSVLHEHRQAHFLCNTLSTRSRRSTEVLETY